MAETVRCFIAIELSQDIKTLIKKTQVELQELPLKITWVQPENAHITLKFLGDVPQSQIQTIQQKLASLAADHHIFNIHTTTLGAFPNTHQPRVLWIGIDDQDHICKMAKNIENMLEGLGIPKDNKAFHPHITLGRVKNKQNRHLQSKTNLNNLIFQRCLQNIVHFTLFQSTLTLEGPVYTPLGKFNLEKNQFLYT
jgi:2'-5' RNA ligase